jgi:hypothetical protein
MYQSWQPVRPFVRDLSTELLYSLVRIGIVIADYTGCLIRRTFKSTPAQCDPRLLLS